MGWGVSLKLECVEYMFSLSACVMATARCSTSLLIIYMWQFQRGLGIARLNLPDDPLFVIMHAYAPWKAPSGVLKNGLHCRSRTETFRPGHGGETTSMGPVEADLSTVRWVAFAADVDFYMRPSDRCDE